jgi:hypothetical protein
VRHRLPNIPEHPDNLSVLALRRSGSLTIFVLDASEPVVVGKIPIGDAQSVAVEESALLRAEPSGVAPRHVGTFGGASVQQAIRGAPLELVPLTPESAPHLSWSPEHQSVADALVRLSGTTAASTATDELDPWVGMASSDSSLGDKTRASVSAAVRDVRSIDRSVLRQVDTSVQNCLMHEGSFAGLVDWELAEERGVAGFDILNFAAAYLDHSLGLKRWSESAAVEAFELTWGGSSYMDRAREAAREAAAAAEVPDSFQHVCA